MDWIRDHLWETWLGLSIVLGVAEMFSLDLIFAMLAAEIVLDPVWPWSEPGGLLALGCVAAGLAAITVWTYLGQRRAGWKRIAAPFMQ